MKRSVNSDSNKGRDSPRDEFSKSKLIMSLDYIFGRGTSKGFHFSNVEFQYSRRTGRLKYVLDESTGQILFSFRPNGSIAPTVAGASRLICKKGKLRQFTSRPKWTVTVINGVSEVVSKGKTVFCKHVAYCSDSLRSGEDVAILNEDGALLAVGRAVLAGPFMKQFKRGPAVKIREGTGQI